MIQCTEPAAPAVIVFCDFPVSLQEAVSGLKTPSPITVLLERGEGFFWQLQVRSKEERPAQAIFRQTQTDASRLRQTDRQTVSLVDVTILWTIIFPLPNLSGRLSQDVGHGL